MRRVVKLSSLSLEEAAFLEKNPPAQSARYLGTSGYEMVLATGVETVVLSVLLHGLTAAPLVQRYGRWKQAHASS